eukprot:33958-Pelagomonas_calceolata.AAC.1
MPGNALLDACSTWEMPNDAPCLKPLLILAQKAERKEPCAHGTSGEGTRAKRLGMIKSREKHVQSKSPCAIKPHQVKPKEDTCICWRSTRTLATPSNASANASMPSLARPSTVLRVTLRKWCAAATSNAPAP